MKQGQYILDRWMVGIIRDICEKRGIAFVSYSDDWILELTKDSKQSRIFGYKFDLNDSAASSIAGDKVATYQLLTRFGVPAVEHRLVRTKASESSGWEEGLEKVVVKPLDGTSGHGIALLGSPTEVEQYISNHPYIAAWAVSPYEEIQSERRLIVLDGEILCQYEKQPVEISGLKMFNLGLGATAVHSETTQEEIILAKLAVRHLDIRLASVDVITTPTGHKVLEVNDGIMMENYMRQSKENVQTATQVFERIISVLL